MKSFAIILKSIALSTAAGTSAMQPTGHQHRDAATSTRCWSRGPGQGTGIGDYRKANGVFKSAEELAMVKGIGLKTVEKNRDRIELGRTAPPPKPVAKGAAASAPKAKPVVRR